jgi:hypothetical protein
MTTYLRATIIALFILAMRRYVDVRRVRISFPAQHTDGAPLPVDGKAPRHIWSTDTPNTLLAPPTYSAPALPSLPVVTDTQCCWPATTRQQQDSPFEALRHVWQTVCGACTRAPIHTCVYRRRRPAARLSAAMRVHYGRASGRRITTNSVPRRAAPTTSSKSSPFRHNDTSYARHLAIHLPTPTNPQ